MLTITRDEITENFVSGLTDRINGRYDRASEKFIGYSYGADYAQERPAEAHDLIAAIDADDFYTVELALSEYIDL